MRDAVIRKHVRERFRWSVGAASQNFKLSFEQRISDWSDQRRAFKPITEPLFESDGVDHE